MIPERLLHILRRCEDNDASPFPATEVFNEGWMLRLVLDAMQMLRVRHQLGLLDGAKWCSEALLTSPFRPRTRTDRLAEGFTNADGVIGDFDFRASTSAGLSLRSGCRQFVVVEAKMFSNLSSGTKNAPGYNQAARNVACMAEAIWQASLSSSDLESVGFFVVAPRPERRRPGFSNLETCTTALAVRSAVAERIGAYEALGRSEAAELRQWESESFRPLMDRLEADHALAVLSWEDCIETIRGADERTADELDAFYQRCLRLGLSPQAQPNELVTT